MSEITRITNNTLNSGEILSVTDDQEYISDVDRVKGVSPRPEHGGGSSYRGDDFVDLSVSLAVGRKAKKSAMPVDIEDGFVSPEDSSNTGIDIII